MDKELRTGYQSHLYGNGESSKQVSEAACGGGGHWRAELFA